MSSSQAAFTRGGDSTKISRGRTLAMTISIRPPVWVNLLPISTRISSTTNKYPAIFNYITYYPFPWSLFSNLSAESQNNQAPWVGSGLTLQLFILHPPHLRHRSRRLARCHINSEEMQHHL